ncbi:MAG: esterase, partial [Allomuricauda sp.]
MEKIVSYTSKNSYLTMNQLTNKTRNVWVVFHGIGYLSKYFIKYFEGLDSTENYIIAPQAPSKYYLKNEYKYVGASWLTKENTTLEIENVMNYVDSVFEAESIP